MWIRPRAGTSLALSELDRAVHVCDAFEPPARWSRFGSLDWGFAHPWVFIWYAVDEGGVVYCCDTIRGRRQLPRDIAERIRSRCDIGRLRYVVAGHDCWADVRARGENGPTIAEQLLAHGLLLSQANISRRAGLNNLRRYVAWRGQGPEGEDSAPLLRFMKTPGNGWLFEQLETLVCDPDDPEDVLKVNADPDTGEGGDDGYDSLRYGLASRPPAGRPVPDEEPLRCFSREVLAYEAERMRRSRPLPLPGRGGGLEGCNDAFWVVRPPEPHAAQGS